MRSFLQQIKKTNDIFTVKERVSTKYEIAVVTEKLDGSKAALFENVKGIKSLENICLNYQFNKAGTGWSYQIILPYQHFDRHLGGGA